MFYADELWGMVLLEDVEHGLSCCCGGSNLEFRDELASRCSVRLVHRLLMFWLQFTLSDGVVMGLWLLGAALSHHQWLLHHKPINLVAEEASGAP